MVFTISPAGVNVPPGSEATLRYQTWADYEALLASRGDSAAVKIRYNAHTQELRIMASLPAHGRRIDSLVDLVKALHVLTAAGYEDRLTSPTFPTVDVKTTLPQYVERAWTAGSSLALREFEVFLQSQG